jgi:hypothetical protein
MSRFPVLQTPTCYCLVRVHLGAGIATRYDLDERGVGIRVLVGSRIFSSPRHPGRLRRSPNLLLMGIGRSFPGSKAVGA